MIREPVFTLSAPTLGLVVVLLIVGIASYVAYTKRTRAYLLPPGPPGHWLLGNAMPKSYAHRRFEEWTQMYGPLFSLRKGREIIIVIGRHQAALEIMEKEGASLVDRPRSIAAGETLSNGMRTLLLSGGDRLRKYRRALHAHLQQKVAETYEPTQMENAKRLVLDILEEPRAHQSHAKRYAASVIMTLTYGKTTPTSCSDPEVKQVNAYAARLGKALNPGAYLVDTIPLLKYVPGYLITLRQWHQEELALFRSQLDAVRRKMDTNQCQPCFAKYLLERQEEFELSFDELAYLAGSMFGAGSDTSASAISVVMMAAACYPGAQRRLQEELDLVIGNKRLPTFGDWDSIPKVMAFVYESYRWRPVSVGGFAHKASKDISWRNYCIPKGATVIGNHWSIARDPVVFPNPETFDPQRWIDESGQLRGDMRYFNFGFGRRVCVGQHVANRSLFINTALLLWAFDISEDPSKPIDTLAFTDIANSHPLPFCLVFKPRKENLKALIGSHIV